MTSEQRRVYRLAKHQCPDATAIRHIHPHAYCVAKPAHHCAVFVIPPQDREPQVPGDGAVLIQNWTVSAIIPGMWCAIVYVCRPTSSEFLVVDTTGA